jgi:hypothetical protein
MYNGRIWDQQILHIHIEREKNWFGSFITPSPDLQVHCVFLQVPPKIFKQIKVVNS